MIENTQTINFSKVVGLLTEYMTVYIRVSGSTQGKLKLKVSLDSLVMII